MANRALRYGAKGKAAWAEVVTQCVWLLKD
jgi:hypothetical protein